MCRIHPENSQTSEQCILLKRLHPKEEHSRLRNKYRCRLHPRGGHSQLDCWVKCSFCGKRGLHLSRDCNLKDIIKQSFINQKISKFGPKAETLARGLTSEEGIKRVTDLDFEQMLRLQLQENHRQPKDKTTCSLCGKKASHLYGPYRLENGILKSKRPKSPRQADEDEIGIKKQSANKVFSGERRISI